MMSETSARASRLARWLGSFERKGLSGRLAPASEGAGAVADAGVAGRAGVAVTGAGGVALAWAEEGGVAARGAEGTKGGADGTKGGVVPCPAVGCAAGVGRGGPPDGRKGGCCGVCGAGVNSGTPDVGEGGVAVADAVFHAIDSGRGRGAAGTSADRGAGGGAAGGGGEKGGADAAPGGRGTGSPKMAWSQPLFPCGVGRGGVGDGWFEVGDVCWLPRGGVVCPVGAGIDMTPPQTEQRARTPAGGTFAGSTRKIERQSGQLTFIHSLRSFAARVSQAAPAALHVRHCACPPYKPSQVGFWRTSSSRSQVGSPDGRRSMCGGDS
jgi:hypothetical protein